MVENVPGTLTVVFDGDCGMCTCTVNALRSRDHGGRLTFVPCQSTRGVEQFGVTGEECAASVWAISPDSIPVSGGEAAVLIAGVLMQKRWPVVVGGLPVVHHALDRGYRFVARNRSRFPGETPWCAVHPDDCS